MRTFVAKTFLLSALFGVSVAVPQAAWAQSPVAPTLIPVTGRLVTAEGQARTGTVNLTISLYDGQADANPRWIEQQLGVALDASGGYSIQFGATLPDGLPGDLFTAGGGTRWLGVTVEGQPEQPRVMLLSVPYAAKAASAETLGGKSASDFVLSSTFRDDLRSVLQEEGVASTSDEASTDAVLNSLQKSNGSGGMLDSTVYEVGGKVGIGKTNPADALEVSGDIRIDDGGYPHKLKMAGDFSVFEATSPTLFRINAGGWTNVGISGRVGIGTTTPVEALHVSGGHLRIGDGAYPHRIKMAGDYSVLEAHNASLLWLNAGGWTNVTISGNVGIGTVTPTQRLHVVGNVAVTGDVVAAGVLGAKYQDVAEWVETMEHLEPGTVVVVDPKRTNGVIASTRAYDSGVAGAVSPQPGLILGEKGPNKAMIAQSGRVRIKADAKYGAIKPGDLVVTSPRAGYAMRAKTAKVKPGTVLGKALEGLPKGDGEILVLITLQ